jgi:hypothetical protein
VVRVVPWAVMIKAVHTIVAHRTVFGTRRPIYIARATPASVRKVNRLCAGTGDPTVCIVVQPGRAMGSGQWASVQ